MESWCLKGKKYQELKKRKRNREYYLSTKNKIHFLLLPEYNSGLHFPAPTVGGVPLSNPVQGGQNDERYIQIWAFREWTYLLCAFSPSHKWKFGHACSPASALQTAASPRGRRGGKDRKVSSKEPVSLSNCGTELLHLEHSPPTVT